MELNHVGLRPTAGDVARHPLLQELARLGNGIGDMLDIAKLNEDPAWLTLPAARRVQALRRLDAISAYLAAGDGSTSAAKRASASAGTSLRLFYGLLSDWRAQRQGEEAIWPLVPYEGRETASPARLDPDVELKLRELIGAEMAAGCRSRPDIVTRVRRRFDADGIKAPAPNTVRRFVDLVGGDALIDRAVLSRETPGEIRARAHRHGEVLVVDHVRLGIYGDQEDRPAPITLTIAIDLATATIAGFHATSGTPSPATIRGALLHAVKVSEDNPGAPVSPWLVVNATSGAAWRKMERSLNATGMRAEVRFGTRLHTGVFARRLIGPRIGFLEISPRPMKRTDDGGPAFDVRRHALVTQRQAELVVGRAVEDLNASRLLPDVTLNRIELGSL